MNPRDTISRSRTAADRFVHSNPVQRFVVAVILLNAVTLGLETSDGLMARHGDLLHFLDKAFLAIFIAELLVKIYARRLRFFTDSWNVFDFVVVGIAIIPGSGAFAVLRSLRVLRVLRLISAVPQLRRVVDALIKAVPGISSIAALLGILFYVGSVMATALFKDLYPNEFGSVGKSLFSLFQIMTLDNWSVLVRDVWTTVPWAPAFFIPFILLSSFTVLNLLVAVIIDAMQDIAGSSAKKAAANPAGNGAATSDTAATSLRDSDNPGAATAELKEEIALLRKSIDNLKSRLP